MEPMTALRRRPWLIWPASALAVAVLIAGAYLVLYERDGQIAVDFIAAVEEHDLDEVDDLTDTSGGGTDVDDAVWPDFPWTDAKLVGVSPNDSAYDYDVAIEAASSALPDSSGGG